MQQHSLNPASPAHTDTLIANDPVRMHAIFKRQQADFFNDPMPTLQQRKAQLAVLKTLLSQHAGALTAAINADFTARSNNESMLLEITPCMQSISYTLKKLRKWIHHDKRSVDLHFFPADAFVVYQPLGVVGIVVPYNYPLYLAIQPLISALAAGNRVMIKMSELTPETATALRNMLLEGFSEDHICIVTGEADIAAAFTRLPFDHLLFTGSIPVGKLVMRAAADNLIPVTLELGGKSPAIIADDIPLQHLIDRLCFAKSLNAGQTCVAPDYILLPRNRLDDFIRLYTASFQRMFPTLSGNPDYTSIINKHSYQRLQDLLQDAREKGAKIIKVGDEVISDGTWRMPVHLLTAVNDNMRVMQEEVFGPILPLLPYDTIEQALDYVRQRPKPLALYLFTYDRALQLHVSTYTHAGSMCINDAVLQVSVDDLPFGGIGASGMGQYHGHEGFLTFSKAKSVMRMGRLNTMQAIYPPYGGRLQRWLLRWLGK